MREDKNSIGQAMYYNRPLVPMLIHVPTHDGHATVSYIVAPALLCSPCLQLLPNVDELSRAMHNGPMIRSPHFL